MGPLIRSLVVAAVLVAAVSPAGADTFTFKASNKLANGVVFVDGDVVIQGSLFVAGDFERALVVTGNLDISTSATIKALIVVGGSFTYHAFGTGRIEGQVTVAKDAAVTGPIRFNCDYAKGKGLPQGFNLVPGTWRELAD